MIETTRPEADGRRVAVFVFNELKADGGRLTQFWLARLRAFSRQGWATHAALINRDSHLERTVAKLVKAKALPSDTAIHHFAARDRRIRPIAWATPEPGASIDPVVADWLDWLTERLPGATVFADSPAAYPYLAGMTNPLVSLVAGVHLNHWGVTPRHHGDPSPTPGERSLTPRFAERFAPVVERFDQVVVLTQAQAADLRSHFGADLPVRAIPALIPDATGLQASGAQEASPAERDIEDGLIVSLGDLEPAAHHQQAIDALALIAADVPNAHLEIHGAVRAGGSHADYAELLAHRAADRGVADRVRIVAPAAGSDPFRRAAVTVWAGRRESCPLQLVRSLRAGVPVVANDAPYGPAELITAGAGLLVPLANAETMAERTAGALRRVLTQAEFRRAAQEGAAAMRTRTSVRAVGQAWCHLASELEDQLWDRDLPHVLTESVMSTNRIFRMPGVIVNSEFPYDQWFIELPGLTEPAAYLSDPRVPGSWNKKTRGPDPTFDPDRRVRPILVHLRSNALAYVATRTGETHTLSLTDPNGTVAPLLSAAFDPVLIVSRVGNAVMARTDEGTITIEPRRELIYAEEVDGRVHSKLTPQSQPTDVTHAISWGVDIDWKDFEQVSDGLRFSGLLRCKRIAPALHSAPAICVRDLGGYSRSVGQLEFLDEPTIVDQSFEVPVGGVLLADPLVATTQLAHGALALHVGYRGSLHPVGGLWTHGRRAAIFLTCNRGTVTLLPSPGGRILAAPGRGRRARAFGAVKTVLRRK